jgi:hypothetical protein
MTTIVSAFLCDVNNRKDINIDKYFEFGILILKADIPKIIFADEQMYEKIKYYENEKTKILLYNKSESYLYSYINDDSLVNFNIKTNNPKKDTKEYIFTQCNKTEWVRKAITLNYFNTDNFIWMDFGIRHVFQCDDDNFIQSIEQLYDKNYNDKVRIASIWNTELLYSCNIYQDITWYFAGGVFGGNKECLLLFSKKMEDECIKIISEKQTLIWEVNLWYLIYKDNKDLFYCYECNHNDTIINNY